MRIWLNYFKCFVFYDSKLFFILLFSKIRKTIKMSIIKFNMDHLSIRDDYIQGI